MGQGRHLGGVVASSSYAALLMPKDQEPTGAWAQLRRLAQLDAILHSFACILLDLGAQEFAKEVEGMRKRNAACLAKVQGSAYRECNQNWPSAKGS